MAIEMVSAIKEGLAGQDAWLALITRRLKDIP